MKPIVVVLVVTATLLGGCMQSFTSPLQTSWSPFGPSAADVESLVREHLADKAALPRVSSFTDAQLTDFELLNMVGIGDERWRAETRLGFDYGSAPADVVGFQRWRQGRYQMDIGRDGEAWRVLRF